MRYTGLFALFAVLVLGLIGGAIGYNVGVHIGANVAVANGTVVAPAMYPYWGWGFGFGGFFGFFFFLLIIFALFAVIRRIAWGGRRGWGPGPGWSGYGHHGYWKSGYGPDDAFDRWHRQAHGEPEQPPTDPVTGRPMSGPNPPPTTK